MSSCELIELKDLSLTDRIELAPPPQALPPAPVVRLLGGDSVSIEGPAGGGAKGHHFLPSSHSQLPWCDLCGEFIWGLYKQSLRCSHCRYTCHYRCRPLVQLDCVLSEAEDVSEDTVETNVDEQVDGGGHELSVGEVHQKVKEYNAQTSSLHMVPNPDGSYTGFIRVQFKLARPVSVLPPPPPPRKLSLPPPPEEEEEEEEEDGRKTRRRRTSFYLPRDASGHLHVSSRTRAREVIEALLRKFTVVDNPAKFALFERRERAGQVFLRKLCEDERPLLLRLCAGPSERLLSLVLKENETGDVNWDAFSVPELCNFLRMLRREEEERVRQIVRRYAVARDNIQQAVASVTKPR